MRVIGHLATEEAANAFSDFLYVRGIKNEIEHDKDHGWAVWIYDEEHLAEAAELLAAFRRNPDDAQYRQHRSVAEKMRKQEARAEADYAKKVKTSREVFSSLTSAGFGPLTVGLIAASVVVFVLSQFGQNPVGKVPWLFISEYGRGLPEIRAGQFWRLVTPIFIHFGFLHLFFNMLWLQDLGGMLEARLGTIRMAVLVVVIAVLSNVAQFAWAGPLFGGMSGVVYGLIGYIWMRGKYDPGCGLFLHPWTVAMAAIWFLLCLINIVPAANAAHAVGLGIGVVWGRLAALRHK